MTYDFKENRQIRIFISSTFRDMMRERDYLITRIFPELRRYCEERDISLFELDLRWGVTQEESENSMTFKICLNEVNNTCPFFIGLIGERYGWVPDDATIEKMRPTNVFEEYEWLLGELQNKKSVTETEIIEGAFNPTEKVNAYFYFRSAKMDTPDEFREVKGSHGDKMLTQLKNKIKSDKRYDSNDYDNVEQLGRQVEEDFKALVDKLFPGQGPLSGIEKERLQQYVFLKSKTRAYVTNKDWMKFLDDFAEGGEKAAAVSGRSGMGESALLANWIVERQKKQIKNEKIIFHFTGISQSESDYQKINQRLIDEVRSIYNIPKKNNESFENDEEDDEDDELQNLLFLIPKDQKLVIVLASLDRLDDIDNAKMLNWLPEYPENVKMILSAAKGDKCIEAMTRKNVDILELEALSLEIRRELIIKYFEKFSKKFSKEQIERILQSKTTENPGVLISILDNLRMFGVFEIFDKQIDERLNQKNEEDLFDLFLQTIESLFNEGGRKNTVKEILSLIAVSRRGLTETEIVNISKVPKLYWSQLLNCLTVHLVTINGFVTFSNSMMLKAAKNRYLKESGAEEKNRKFIYEYMETGKEVLFERKCEELPFQYMESKNWDKLYNFLLDYKVFNHLNDKKRYELGSYWHALIKQDKTRYTMEKYLNIDIEDKEELVEFFSHICSFIKNVIFDFSAYFVFAKKFLELSEKHFGNDHNKTASANNDIGNYYNHMKDYENALVYYKKARLIWEKISDWEYFVIATAYNNIASCYDKMDDRDKAIKYYNKALEIITKEFGEEEPIAAAIYNNMGSCYNSVHRPNFKEASKYSFKAMEIQEKVYGKGHPKTALSYSNLGLLKYHLQENDEALKYMEAYRNIWIKYFGEDFDNVALSYNSSAFCYIGLNDYEKAPEYSQKSIEIYEKLHGKDCKEASSSYYTSALCCKALEQFEQAIEYYKKFLAYGVEGLSEENVKVLTTKYNIGNCYFELGDFENALVYFNETIPVFQRAKGDHYETAWAFCFAAMCYDQMREYKKALPLYKEAVRINNVLGLRNDNEELEIAVERITDIIGDAE